MQRVQEALPVKAVVQRHYIVEAVLSRGDAGNTYLMRDKRQGQKQFILKEIIHPRGKVGHRFPAPSALLQQLEHPALPRVYHTFMNDQRTRSYLLIEFIKGSSASSFLSRLPGQRLGLQETIELMAPIMDAVAYLHRQQPPIIHRDIKPSNIIVSPSGHEAFLVDFGLAKQYDVDATTSVIRLGSPGYCPPEQYSNQGTSPRVDIYALGATFYKFLTGTTPIESVERIMQLYESKNDPLQPLDEKMPGLPSSVANAVHRALSVDSESRFVTVEQFWEALGQTTSGWLQRSKAMETVGVQQEERSEFSLTVPEAEKQRATSSDVGPTPVLVGNGRRQRMEVGQQVLPIHRSRKKRPLRAGALVAFAAMLLLSVGMSLWSLHPPSSHSTSTRATVSLGAAASRPTVLASLARMESYRGTMYNITRNMKEAMSLIDVQRQQQAIRGIFQGPLWNGAFVGIIDVTGRIQFVVTSRPDQETFSFNGAVRGDGTFAGSYCQPTRNGQCSSYGLWSVVPDK